jgi:hypothetical protein
MQLMADTWKSWHVWIRMKRDGQLQNSKAVGFLKNIVLGKAWNTWVELHEFCLTAKKVWVGLIRSGRMCVCVCVCV